MNRSVRRRAVAMGIPLAVAAFLVACGTNPVTGQPQPPTLADVQNWLQTASQELPAFINELGTTGTLKGTQLSQATTYLGQFQQLVTAFMQMPAGSDPTTVLNDIASVIATIMSFIPQAAPFVPLVLGLQAIIAAYLAQRPVQSPSGTPVPVPAPPTAAALQGMHAQTRSMRVQPQSMRR